MAGSAVKRMRGMEAAMPAPPLCAPPAPNFLGTAFAKAAAPGSLIFMISGSRESLANTRFTGMHRLAIFDFDHSLIDDNSDTLVVRGRGGWG